MKYLLILLLSSCSLTTSISMKCKGECSMDVEREVEVKGATPIGSLEP